MLAWRRGDINRLDLWILQALSIFVVTVMVIGVELPGQSLGLLLIAAHDRHQPGLLAVGESRQDRLLRDRTQSDNCVTHWSHLSSPCRPG